MSYQEIAQEAFTAASAFYAQPGAIGTNYRVPHPGLADSQVVANYEQCMAAAEGTRNLIRLNKLPISTGLLMRETNNTLANCAGMAFTAASLLWERHPTVPVTCVFLPQPADTTFLVVGAPPPPGTKIEALRDVPRDVNSYVVDVLSGNCCHISAFPNAYLETMRRWDNEGMRNRDGRTFARGERVFLNASITTHDLAPEARYHSDKLSVLQRTTVFSEFTLRRQQEAGQAIQSATTAWYTAMPHLAPSAYQNLHQVRTSAEMATHPQRLAVDFYRAQLLNFMRPSIDALPTHGQEIEQRRVQAEAHARGASGRGQSSSVHPQSRGARPYSTQTQTQTQAQGAGHSRGARGHRS